MAPNTQVSPLATLRALSFRLTTTPTELLPQSIHYFTSSLAACAQLLATEHAPTKDAADASVVVHKFRTQLSTLLQDRTIHGRWAATALVKSAVEVGGWETLQKSGPWVRGLLNILTKPDPPATKKLCVITLTRIFVLTRDYPTLVREITTPSLGPFITSCLNNIAPKSLLHISQQTPSQRALLETVLESFSQLLPRHSTTFRTFRGQIRFVLDQCLAPTPSSLWRPEGSMTAPAVPRSTSEVARRLHVQMHHCAQKNTAADEWNTSFEQTIRYSHLVCDKVFRAVIEDWQSVAGIRSTAKATQFDEQIQEFEKNELGLPYWSGIHAGCERLVGILGLLTEFLITPTAAPVTIRLGLLSDLLSRVFALTVPLGSSRELQDRVRHNNQVGKEERDGLWAALPSIHVAGLEVLLAILTQFPDASMPMAQNFLDQMVWVFEAEKSIDSVRAAIYTVTAKLIELTGPSLSKVSIQTLRPCIRESCRDLLPDGPDSKPTASEKASANGAKKVSVNLDTSLNPVKSTTVPKTKHLALERAAQELVVVFLSNIPSTFIPHPLRTELDRTAVLLRDKDAMLASVLNPVIMKRSGKPTPSILPVLAQSGADCSAVESLIRPRMPVIRTGIESSISMTEEMEEDEEEESADEIEDEEVTQQLDEPVANKPSQEKENTRYISTQDEVTTQLEREMAQAGQHPSPLKRTPSISAITKPPSPKRARFAEQAVPAPVAVESTIPVTGAALQTSRGPSSPQPLSHDGPSAVTTGNASPTPHSSTGDQVLVHTLRTTVDIEMEGESDDDFGELVLGADTDEDE